MRACGAIAALANRGARALRVADLLGADLLGRSTPIDLRNDGRLTRVVREDRGTGDYPYLVDETGGEVTYGRRDDYLVGPGRPGANGNIAIVRVGGRVWEVSWGGKPPDNDAVLLQAATDGAAVCRFRRAFRPPVLKTLAGGEREKAGTYRALLLGRGGRQPPSAELDAHAVEAASELRGLYYVQSQSWRVDLSNNGRPLALIRIDLLSGAGTGCARYMLGLVQDGRIAKIDFLPLWGTGWVRGSDMVLLSRALRRLVTPLSCVGLVETPVLGPDGRAYVLLDNTAGGREPGGGVRLLVGTRGGRMQPLAGLSWQGWNVVDRHVIELPSR